MTIDPTYLAIVVPIKFSGQDSINIPAYWLLPNNQSSISTEKTISALVEILVEPLLENLWFTNISDLGDFQNKWQKAGYNFWAEKQFLPGVTDNLAHIVEEALKLQSEHLSFQVASGQIYLAKDKQTLENAEYRLFHPLVERFQIHNITSPTRNFSFPTVSLSQSPEPETIDLCVSDEQLINISKERLLALTLEEMLAIKNYYSSLSAKPTDVELEIIAQTWSEHCKHKIFNAQIEMEDCTEPDDRKKYTITSLYRSYIQRATKELKTKRSDLLSVFKDNSGVVKWDDNYAVCFKVETHNSPSALEPYGGSLTGILGVNRDILGTGLGAKPIFNTDILCFAYPADDLPERPKLLPATVLMEGIRKGIQDGGNKSGIPTVNGAIVFHPGYRAKPLVFCGTGGILPLTVNGLSAYEKHTKAGDRIVMAGGRVGKDGIHGATFSSEALHEGSPVTAVQIGDPFTQKRLLDFVLAARDKGLITGITDNGAGGLSSSVGEMATITGGAKINLDHIPTKYPGLSAWEIVISESQERMTISTNNFATLAKLAKKYNVEVSDIGEFNCSGKFEITHHNKLVASIDLQFLHEGAPQLELKASWLMPKQTNSQTKQNRSLKKNTNTKALLLQILSHPNICSREAVIRQYDHEVQGGSVIKPLMGNSQSAPCDAAVITPILGQSQGLVISNGLCPQLSQTDPYLMAQSALDEAIRNAICVGADPDTISILDNFCWPDPIASASNPQGKLYLGMLVKACQGLYDAAIAMGTPMISGKDSMKNDFDDGVIRLSIPPTLLISAMGKIGDINHCLTSEFKQVGDHIFLLSAGTLGTAGSIYSQISACTQTLPSLDLKQALLLYKALHQAILKGWINSAHDLSEGGLAIALSEAVIGSGLGANIDFIAKNTDMAFSKLESATVHDLLFAEGPAQILVSVPKKDEQDFRQHFKMHTLLHLGHVTDTQQLKVNINCTNGTEKLIKEEVIWQISELQHAWSTPLPFA